MTFCITTLVIQGLIVSLSITTLRITTLSIMEQHTLRSVNNCLNTNICSYLETSGGQSSNLYLNVVNFLNTRADKKSVAA
jgi:hypothetical protein